MNGSDCLFRILLCILTHWMMIIYSCSLSFFSPMHQDLNAAYQVFIIDPENTHTHIHKMIGTLSANPWYFIEECSKHVFKIEFRIRRRFTIYKLFAKQFWITMIINHDWLITPSMWHNRFWSYYNSLKSHQGFYANLNMINKMNLFTDPNIVDSMNFLSFEIQTIVLQ